MKFDLRYIYVMHSFSHPYRFKCGISRDVHARRAKIQQEISDALNKSVTVRIAAYVPSLFSEHQETKIHRWLEPIRDKGMTRHAGYSEWFWGWQLNFLFAAILWIACYSQGVILGAYAVAIITGQPFYPIMPVLIVIGVIIVEMLIFLAVCLLVGAVIFYGVNIIV